MERSEVINLIDSATLQAIKTLTSKRSLMKSKFFVVENIPTGLSIQKVVSYLQNSGKLNFLFFAHKRLDVRQSNSCSWIFGCKNSSEFNQFIWQHKEIYIDGCILMVRAAKKDLEVRHAVMDSQVSNLPFKLIKMKCSPSHNRFFPTERLMELLIESDTSNALNLVDGILLFYKHVTRTLQDEILISSSYSNNLDTLIECLSSMGNRDVHHSDGSLFLMDKSVWARQRSAGGYGDFINTINPALINKDIISNGQDFTSIRNSLL